MASTEPLKEAEEVTPPEVETPAPETNGIGKGTEIVHPPPSAKRPFSIFSGPYFAVPPKDGEPEGGCAGG